LRPGERAMLCEAPSSAVQPVVDLLSAVDVAVAEVHGEFAAYQRSLHRLGVWEGLVQKSASRRAEPGWAARRTRWSSSWF
jgi:hypothetical protein